MSNSIWDWWFGDAPAAHSSRPRATAERRGARRLERWFSWVSEATARRRLLLFLAVSGASAAAVPGWVMASEPASELDLLPAAVSWAPSPGFAMILAEEGESPASNEAEAAGPRAGQKEEVLDEDARRRQRLRDLLGEDADPSPTLDASSGGLGTLRRDGETSGSDEGEKGVFAKPFIETRLPKTMDGRFVLPPIRAVSIDQKPIGNGRVPETVNGDGELQSAPLPEDGYSRLSIAGGGTWPHLCRPWAAPNTFSHPLYFEDRMLERHGHERWGCFQPLAAGARFYATLPMLPYLATIQPPCDTVYSKGYYRAGSPAPKLLQRPPFEQRAAIVEAAVLSGTIVGLP